PKRLFDEVQDTLAGRFNVRTKGHQFLFRRLIACKGCGYSLIGETKKGHIYYRCHTRVCPEKGIREEAVAAVVEGALKKLEFSEVENESFGRAIQTLKENWFKQKEEELAVLNVKREQVTERLNRLTDAYLDQALERDLFETRKTALLMERRAI